MYRRQTPFRPSFSERPTLERSLQSTPAADFEALHDRRPFVSFSPSAEGPQGAISGRYLLGEPLGFGGTATIYSAIDMASQRQVAIKIASYGSEFANQSVMREAEALSSLDQPGIVRFIDSGTYHESPFIVMEYLRAMDLHAMIADNGPLPWRASVPTLIELCDTIGCLHEADMVHGDIKPANVMLLPVPEGHLPSAKLVDFGMSRRPSAALGIAGDPRPEYVYGTIEYISPEQFSSTRAYYDPRVDVYSFGVLMYAMLTRKNPFLESGNCNVERMLMVLNRYPPHPSSLVRDVPEKAGDVVMRAIAKSPDERYRSMGDLAEAIRSAL
ncbi:MAG: serine/threonine-protein kinase [Candidatus Micrarchaeota archaeon]